MEVRTSMTITTFFQELELLQYLRQRGARVMVQWRCGVGAVVVRCTGSIAGFALDANSS